MLTRHRNLPQSELAPSEHPLWLLGFRYELQAGDAVDEKEVARLCEAASRLPYFSYRWGFPPLGDSRLTSDAGWGCTFRSGQMLLAQTLQTQLFRLHQQTSPPDADADAIASSVYATIQRLFEDTPAAPFGIHALCRSGDALPGCWLGPHALCLSLSAAIQAWDYRIGDESRGIGGGEGRRADADLLRLRCEVVGGAGGAPQLFLDDLGDACTDASTGAFTPLLLLLSLRLGPDRTLDPAYAPQLAAVLRVHGCVGIVGGRPGHSLFFVGTCGEAGSELLFLDPHEAHPHGTEYIHAAAAAAAAAAGGDDSPAVEKSRALRHMPALAADPCCALGFWAESKEELRLIGEGLAAAAGLSPSSPLLTVSSRRVPEERGRRISGMEEETDEEGYSLL